jgi:hypothetical protein
MADEPVWRLVGEEASFEAGECAHHFAAQIRNAGAGCEECVAYLGGEPAVGLEEWRQPAAGEAVKARVIAAGAGKGLECISDDGVFGEAVGQCDGVDEREIGTLTELWAGRAGAVADKREALGERCLEPNIGAAAGQRALTSACQASKGVLRHVSMSAVLRLQKNAARGCGLVGKRPMGRMPTILDAAS